MTSVGLRTTKTYTAMAGRDKQTNRPADELQACDGGFDKT